MNGVDIAVIVIVCVAVLGVVGYLIYRKVKRKGGCDCGCSECSGKCSCCNTEKEDK